MEVNFKGKTETPRKRSISIQTKSEAQQRLNERQNPNSKDMSNFPKNCFNCRQPGHFAKYCLNVGTQNNPRTMSDSVNQPYRLNKTETESSGVRGSQRPKSQGKVCTMTQSEARDNPRIITGSLMICNFLTSMLFDLRATYSFISSSPAETINRQVEPLENGIYISIPLGEVLLVKQVSRDYKIKFGDITSKVDLILFKLDELNVTLGMNFHTKYHVVLDCFNKEVVLKDPERFEVKFVGNKKVKLA